MARHTVTQQMRAPRHLAVTARPSLPLQQAGVSLIELMVGLLIGLLAVLAITQVLKLSEGSRRTTTSGSDAELTGTLAAYTLKRDIEMAGYGLTASQLGLGCVVRSIRYDAAHGGNRMLAPVVITPGATVGDSDVIRVYAANKSSFSVPTLVTSDHPVAGAGIAEFVVNNLVGAKTGDLMIAVPVAPTAANTCTVFANNGTSIPGVVSVPHASGAGDSGGWNGANQAALLAVFPAGGYPAGSYLVNLGSGGLIDKTYSVGSGSLRVMEYDNATITATTSELFPQVVNLQAFYGKDTNLDGAIDVYDTAAPTTPAGWSQVVAIRIALVVRSNQYEKDLNSAAPIWDLGASPTVTGSTTCGASQCLTLNVNADINATDWPHYRYKIYDTVIPVRNLLWRS